MNSKPGHQCQAQFDGIGLWLNRKPHGRDRPSPGAGLSAVVDAAWQDLGMPQSGPPVKPAGAQQDPNPRRYPPHGMSSTLTPDRTTVPGGVSNRTVCAMLTVLSTALTTAMKRGLVGRNVAQLIDRPAIEHREMSTWTPQQGRIFPRACAQRPPVCVLAANARRLATLRSARPGVVSGGLRRRDRQRRPGVPQPLRTAIDVVVCIPVHLAAM